MRTGFTCRPADSRHLARMLQGVKPIAFLPFGAGELLFERGGRVLDLPASDRATTAEVPYRMLPLESSLLGAAPRGRSRIALAETGGRILLFEGLEADPVERARLAPLTCLWGRAEQPSLFGGREGQVWIWPQEEDPRLVTRLESPVLALAYGGPQRLVSLGVDGAVHLWDSSGKALGVIPTKRRVLCMDWGGEGHLLLGTREGVVEVWKTEPTPALVSDSWDLVEPIYAVATRGSAALAVGRTTFATTAHFVEQNSIQATIRPPPQRVVLDASGDALLTSSEGGLKRWQLTDDDLVFLDSNRSEPASVAKAHPKRGWIVGTRDGRIAQVPPSGPFKLAPLDPGSEIVFVGVSDGRIVGISRAGAVGWIQPGGRQLERKRIPLFAKLSLREAILEGTFKNGTLFADTGDETQAIGFGSRPGRGSVDGGSPLARWRRLGNGEITTLVSHRDTLFRWELGVGLQSVYAAAGRLRQLDPSREFLLVRHEAGLDLVGSGYQPIHRWVAESRSLRSATAAWPGKRVVALYGDRLACYDVRRRTALTEARTRIGGGESWGAASPSGVVARLEGKRLSAFQFGSPELVSTDVDPAPKSTRRLRLNSTGRYALVVSRDAASVLDLQTHKVGDRARNKRIDVKGRYALEDGAWLSPDVFVLTGWLLAGPDQGRLVQLRVDLGSKGAQPNALPMGSSKSVREPGDKPRRARSCASPGRGGTLAVVHDELVIVQNLSQISGPTSAEDARTFLSLQRIQIPKITIPVAMTLDPEANQLFLAGRNPTGAHSIWVTDLPQARPIGVAGRLTIPLGATLWQGRFEVRDLAVSPDRRWLVATGEGFLLFDLQSRTLQAIVSNTGTFHAAFRSPSELVYLENGKSTGTWDLAREGLTTPRDQLVELVAKTTGLRVAGGEVLLEPDALEAYLHVARGR